MAAAVFGARILGEIKEESLDQLLSSLFAALPVEHNPCLPAIPFLHDLLNPPNQDAAAEIHEPLQSPTLAIPSSPSPPDSPEVEASVTSKLAYVTPPLIEILALAPGSKSTHLLSYLVSRLLQTLPNRPKQIVLYFDSSWKVSVQQIHKLLLSQNNGDDVAASETLSRLHLIRPDSSQQILTQLRNIEEYLYSLSDQDCMIAAIVLADLSVWYWNERLEEEMSSQATSASGDRIYSRESLHAMIVEKLRRLQSKFKCVVVVSGLGIIGNINNGNLSSAVRSGLAGSWIRNADIRILLGGNTDGITHADVDAMKWVQKCGGSSQIGKGTFDMQTNSDSISITQFKRSP